MPLGEANIACSYDLLSTPMSSWSTAQQFRRKLNLQDGFGWQIPNTDLSDLRVRCSSWVKKRARLHPMNEPLLREYGSARPVRALKNVCESAWWTKHLAQRMATYCWTTMVVGHQADQNIEFYCSEH